MSNKILAAIIVLFSYPTFAQNKLSKCDPGQTFLVPRLNKTMLYVCDSQVKVPRPLSRGEIFKMYNATKNEPKNLKLWGTIAETEASAEKVLTALKAIPDTDLVVIDDKSPENINTLANWYQEHVLHTEVKPAKTMSSKERAELETSTEAKSFAACLYNKGDLVMSESSKADANGCMCGGKPFRNYVDYSCQNKKLVPVTSAASAAPAASGAQ